VAVAGTRIAPVIAHSIASVNTLAPDRVSLGIGSGNSAYRFMNLKPLPARKYAEEVRVIRALLDGEEVEYTFRGVTAPIRLLMADRGYVDLEHRIPIIVSGFGPKSQSVAGQLGDGLFVSLPVEERSIERARQTVAHAAEEAGRSIDFGSYPVVNLVNVIMLDPGEDILSDRVVAEHGPFIVSGMHYLFDQVRQYAREPPRRLLDVWDKYTALIARVPEHVRHLRIHEGHCTYLLDEERALLTADLVRATSVVGTPEECREQIRRLERAGVTHIVGLPTPGTHYDYAERFAQEIIARY
jgi:alkanesulfonate monooxygenase SsuD/methylene tetrahydromethanopterin reductase-like flavin-dependent oxidoreductase (luciferase family)